MGSGSSKAKNQTVQNTKSSLSPVKHVGVANVNKPDFPSPTATEKQANRDSYVSDTLIKNANNVREGTFQVKENNKDRKEENVSRNNVTSGCIDDPGGLLFEDESDLDYDIDEVLKIPVAVDSSKQNGDSKKRRLERNKENKDFDRAHEGSTNASTDKQEEAPLPETYVQRLQRQQYKFQHNLLLHDEVVRNPREGQEDNDRSTDSYQMEFDATKFRAVNRVVDTKKDQFTAEDERTQRFLPSPQQNFDDFELPGEDASKVGQLPHYDQSELDLMKQLEDGIV